jgi:hypothetical protein
MRILSVPDEECSVREDGRENQKQLGVAVTREIRFRHIDEAIVDGLAVAGNKSSLCGLWCTAAGELRYCRPDAR